MKQSLKFLGLMALTVNAEDGCAFLADENFGCDPDHQEAIVIDQYRLHNYWFNIIFMIIDVDLLYIDKSLWFVIINNYTSVDPKYRSGHSDCTSSGTWGGVPATDQPSPLGRGQHEAANEARTIEGTWGGVPATDQPSPLGRGQNEAANEARTTEGTWGGVPATDQPSPLGRGQNEAATDQPKTNSIKLGKNPLCLQHIWGNKLIN